MTRSRALLLLAVALLLALFPGGAAGQDATPVQQAGQPLDLAAMALAPEDVPAGFFDDYSEILVPAAGISDFVLWGAPTPPGLERTYQSFYSGAEEPMAIHVFLLEFTSPEEATGATVAVEALVRPPLPEGSTIGPVSAPGPAIGDEPSTLTTVSYDSRAAGGPLADIVVASFQRDRLVAGISVERFTESPAEGTPVAEVASPTADLAQEQLAVELAGTLAGRIVDVLAGAAPDGVDPVLGDVLLPIEQLVDESTTPVFGGYKSGIDILRCGICGEENSLVPFADRAGNAIAHGVVVGPLVDGEPSPPFVSITITDFASPEDALAVVEATRRAPNDRPTAIPIPRGDRTLAEDPAIPGATAALAFSANFDPESPDAAVDSAGVDFVVGNWLVTVDVQGGLTGDEAMAVAVDLATQQAACLTAAGACQSISIPAALQG